MSSWLSAFRAVLFDLDGTVVDAFADIAAAANHVRAGLGLPPLTEAEVRRHVGHGARQLVAGVTGLAFDSDQCGGQLGVLLRYYEAHPASHAKPYPGMAGLLDDLRSRSIRTAICTNKPHAVTVPLLERLDLSRRFDAVFGEQPGLPPKPDPEMVRRALDVLGVEPAQAVFIGDSPVDIATARNAGLPVIAVAHGAHSPEELAGEKPDALVEDTAGLIGLLCP